MKDRAPALPAHLLPVACEEGDEIVLEAVETSSDAPLPVGSRREARETSLVILYEADIRGEPPLDVLHAQIVTPPSFTVAAVEGVAARAGEIDALIEGAARNWTLARMPAIDRALLRLGTFELLGRPDVPTGVVLSEIVELAAAYSTAESSRFVNGVLAKLAETVRPPADPTVERDGGRT